MASDNEYRPGFFEVYAANHLSTALRPALRFALDVLSVRHPFLIRIAARSDEIFTAVLLLLETSQLRKESALLAESFYSLRRSKNLSFRPNELIETPLQGKQVFLSILFGVILPHTKTKLDSWYSDATGGAAAALFVSDEPQVSHSVTTSQDSRQMSDNSSAVRLHLDSSLVFNPVRTFARLIRAMKHFLSSPAFLRMVLRWYPRISTCCEGTNLLFNILYLFRHTRYFTLALALQGLVLRRATPTETMKSSSRSTPFFTEGNRSFNLTQVLSATSERVLAVFKMSFFMGIFAFRFLQYYYAAEVCCTFLHFSKLRFAIENQTNDLRYACIVAILFSTRSRLQCQERVVQLSHPRSLYPQPMGWIAALHLQASRAHYATE